MEEIRFTSKQKKVIREYKRGELSRLNLLVGSVRSGKTWISLILWICYIANSPKDGTYLMVARTLTSLKRNCLDLLQSMYPSFRYSISSKEAELCGRKIYLEGANDARAEGKIRGMTLNGAFIDEVTLVGEDFFKMLLSRLSVEGAKLIGSTNPDTPYHWLYKEFIAREEELNLKIYHFKLEDNDTLSKEYIESIKREYTGVYYDRYILGRWTAAEGIIYRAFADRPEKHIVKEVKELINFISIGVDYGASKSKTTFVAIGFTNGMKDVYILKEYGIKGVYEPETIYDKFEEFYNSVSYEFQPPRFVYADYGALGQVITMGLQSRMMRRQIPIKIMDCKKGTINDRIQLTCKLFGQNRLKVIDRCEHIIGAFNNAIWEDGKIDTRLDNGTVEVDYLDAFEYALYDFSKKLIVAYTDENEREGVTEYGF